MLSGEAARLGVKNVQQSVQRENEAVDLSTCCSNEKSSRSASPAPRFALQDRMTYPSGYLGSGTTTRIPCQ